MAESVCSIDPEASAFDPTYPCYPGGPNNPWVPQVPVPPSEAPHHFTNPCMAQPCMYPSSGWFPFGANLRLPCPVRMDTGEPGHGATWCSGTLLAVEPYAILVEVDGKRVVCPWHRVRELILEEPKPDASP